MWPPSIRYTFIFAFYFIFLNRVLTSADELKAAEPKAESPDVHLKKTCANDIAKWGCEPAGAKDIFKTMLCLEAVEKDVLLEKDKPARQHGSLEPACREEVLRVRKLLFDDFSLSPDVLLHCGTLISTHCSEAKGENGGVLHCLLAAVSQPAKLKEKPSAECEAALHDLIKATDVQANIMIDPVIASACQPVISSVCSSANLIEKDHGYLFDCLLENRRHERMTDDCRRHVFELFYFVTRDVTLDEQLTKACNEDSKRLCPSVLQPPQPKEVGPGEGQLLTCLYNHRRPIHRPDNTLIAPISRGCLHEVVRVFKDSAADISLDPVIFKSCIADLAEHCTDIDESDYDDDPDAELDREEDDLSLFEMDNQGKQVRRKKHRSGMACLQDNMELLRPTCREAVVQRTSFDEDEPNLDKLIVRACRPAEQRFCPGMDTENQPQEGGPALFRCLVENKNHPKMEPACRVAINHLQVVAHSDIRISKAFYTSCQADINRHCRDISKSHSTTTIECLSARLTLDRLTAADHEQQAGSSLSPQCVKQIEFELYERSESIDLDPDLKRACTSDVDKLCPGIRPGGGRVIACLHKRRKELSRACHAKLFSRDLDQAADSSLESNFKLATSCAAMIARHCAAILRRSSKANFDINQRPDVLECLASAMRREPEDFDVECKQELVGNLQLRAQDYRLDVGLRDACSSDVRKYCSSELARTSKKEFEEGTGVVLFCLKRHYVLASDPDQALSPACQTRVQMTIALERLDISLDASLMTHCREDITTTCGHEVIATDSMMASNPPANIINCLTQAWQNHALKSKKCGEVVELLIHESMADIQLDPQLSEACTLELASICGSVSRGYSRQAACLLYALDNPSSSSTPLGPKCRTELTKRRKLWATLDAFSSMDTFSQLLHRISTSQSRNYFLIVFFAAISFLFIFGLCCGRVTKRVPASVKMK